MDTRDWAIALIEPNKWEAQIQIDILQAAGVTKIRRFADSAEALGALELFPANIVIMEMDTPPLNGVDWAKQFRRGHHLANRKAAVFMLSKAVSRQMAESCRHAGANAIIGKPISGAALIATIKKVLGNPRPFIDAEGYVGPCRRAGIVTAGMPRARRKSDNSAHAPTLHDLPRAITALASATGDLIRGKAGDAEACKAALRAVHEVAEAAQDAPLSQACAAFKLQLDGDPQRPDFKASVAQCMDVLAKCAAVTIDQSGARGALAESIRKVEKSAAA